MVSRCGRTPGCVPGRVNVPRCGAIAVAGMLCAMAAPGAEAASCAFGGSSEVSLQSVLNAITSTGTIDAGAGCVADGADAYWSTVGSTGSATILVEVAGFSNQNVLGIYDRDSVAGGTPATMLDVFEGSAGAGTSVFITFSPLAGGQYAVAVNGGAPIVFNSSSFGYYLRTPPQGPGNLSRLFFSDTALNPDAMDHMYAYQGSGQTFAFGTQTATEPGKPARSVWAPGGAFNGTDAILAWEDLLSSSSDRDYQDMVVLTRDITPVPLPGAAWLLLGGLGILGGAARRRSA